VIAIIGITPSAHHCDGVRQLVTDADSFTLDQYLALFQKRYKIGR